MSRARARLAQGATLAACLAIAWTAIIAATGGVRFTLASHVISSRSVWRAGALAAALYLCAYLAARPGERDAPWVKMTRVPLGVSAALAVLLAVAVSLFAVRFGARTAGGADAFGYVSQAYLLLRGDLRLAETLSASAPWPYARESLAPLAYTPGASRGTIAPVYPPGTSFLMAAAIKIAGHCGPFYVAPLAAGLLVFSTWMLVQRLSGDGLLSAVTAILTATSPVLLLNAPLPMSDTLAAALWMTSFALLSLGTVRSSALAGFVAAVAIAVRPNLAPLAGALILAAALWGEPSGRWRRMMCFIAAAAPGPVAVMWINAHLHGSPLRSGYGRAGLLYALSNVPGNVNRYSYWLVESHGWLVLAGALLPILAAAARLMKVEWRHAVPIVLFTLILSASYLTYLQFDGWSFLRFFLPGLPFLYVLVAIAVACCARLRPAIVMVPFLAAVLAFMIIRAVSFAHEQGAALIGPGERRYAAVAEFVKAELPANAAFIGLQQTGSLAFYTGRLTLRFSILPPHRLLSVVEWLEATGFHPYIVLEDWEEPGYKARFSAASDPISRLDLTVVAETSPGITVRVYDTRPRSASPIRARMLDVRTAPRCLHPAEPWIRVPPYR